MSIFLKNITLLTLFLLASTPAFAFTDDPGTMGKNKVRTFLVYDPVPWPQHWDTSKHLFFKPGIKYGLSEKFDITTAVSFYQLGFLEYFVALKYKLPWSGNRWVHSLVLTWNHLPNQKLENRSKDYGWKSPFQEPQVKSYYRSWNTHLQYHLGFKINDTFTISMNIGVQYWSLVNRKLNTGWYSNYGIAPAFSFPSIHINFNPKTRLTIGYGDGDVGDLGLIGFSYTWN